MFNRGEREELTAEIARLRQRVAELESANVAAQRLDGPTGALAGRAFRGRLIEEVSRATRYSKPLSLAAMTVDDFESYELGHGFKAGDELLADAAGRLSAATRTADTVGRTGPAELVVVLPETPPEAAQATLDRLVMELETLGDRAVGVSIGIAGLRRGMSAEVLLAEARGACSQAQEQGGGRTALAGAAMPAAAAEDSHAPQQDAVEALAVALLERDRYTGEHSEAVIDMSGAVARTLGLSDVEVQRVRSAALLHDIGKVAIPDEILHKPGPLNDQEWVLMREHPVIGERILRVLPGLGTVARIVRHEHERWDGGGYPDGLVGPQIPLGSRIIIAADTYHAITSDRPYRTARSHQDAVEELIRCAGTQFDPRVTEALIGHLYGQRRAGLAIG
jgi:diguanylate cyclase (GGDEF)-like protein/putative nucleotidyltransferase with HDIG domain